MSIPSLTLNTGAKIPAIGLGLVEDGDVASWCYTAIQAGYRHLDTALIYGSEKATGEAVRRAIAEGLVRREELFVTTKLTETDHADVQRGFEQSLKDLDIGYIDLYLMHWPQAKDPATKSTLPPSATPTFSDTWRAMEHLYNTDGRVKAIGVSNFSVKNLEVLVVGAEVVPAVNQVENHIYLPQKDLTDYCKTKGIVLTAYSPLYHIRGGSSPVFSEPILLRLAEKYGVGAGAISLSWQVQRGWSTIPKSTSASRQKENLKLVTLDHSDFDAVSSIHTEPDKLKSLWLIWGEGKEEINGWSFEQMGFGAWN